LDAWQLLPRPQRLTELYFINGVPPAPVKINSTQNVAFVVHNGEHRTTDYFYKIVASDGESGPAYFLGDGKISLIHNQTHAIHATIKLPPLNSRIKVGIDLEYRGIAPGDTTLSKEQQSIHYWTKNIGQRI
jgi:hypothetical protein